MARLYSSLGDRVRLCLKKNKTKHQRQTPAFYKTFNRSKVKNEVGHGGSCLELLHYFPILFPTLLSNRNQFLFSLVSDVAFLDGFLLLLLDRVWLCARAGVQGCGLNSLQRPPPGSKQLSASASQVAGFTGARHHTQLLFCIFSRDRVSPSWLGWS